MCKEEVIGTEVREMVQPRFWQVFDVTKRSLDVDQRAMKSHCRKESSRRKKRSYLHSFF